MRNIGKVGDMTGKIWKNFEIKISIILLLVVASFSFTMYAVIYNQFYALTIGKLQEDAIVIHKYAEESLDENTFRELNTIEDEGKELYSTAQRQLDEIRRIANIRYLYTAKRTESGAYIYVVDGLDKSAEDFRHIGDPIEPEIIPYLEKCLNDEVFLGSEILDTEWGIIYVTYFPYHDADGTVLGAIGMEFDCANLLHSFERMRAITILLSALLACGFILAAIIIVKRVVRDTEKTFSSMLTSITRLEMEVDKIYYDSLTGIYNRRFLDENLNNIISGEFHAERSFSLMVADIDYFKRYNDAYGHSEGDNCLKIVAEILGASVARPKDFIVRYGGEEFVVVLPNTDEQGAQLIAERMIENMRMRAIPHEKSAVANYVTVSIGIVTGKAECNRNGEDFIKKADQMMYQSKREGRNRYNATVFQDAAR